MGSGSNYATTPDYGQRFIIRMPPGRGPASRTPMGRRSQPIDRYIARHMNLKIMSRQKDSTANPARYGKPKRTSAEKDARSVALGRSPVIRMCPEWGNELDEMNRSKRGRPFAYPDLMMGGIAYIRYVLGEGLRVIEGHIDAMLGRGVKGPDHVTIWRRTCAQAVSMEWQPHHRKDDRRQDAHPGGRLDRHNHHRQGQVDRAQVERKVQLHQAAHPGRRGVPKDTGVPHHGHGRGRRQKPARDAGRGPGEAGRAAGGPYHGAVGVRGCGRHPGRRERQRR